MELALSVWAICQSKQAVEDRLLFLAELRSELGARSSF